METGIIYCIRNLVNGKCYIGRTINPEYRKYIHFSSHSSCSHLKNAIQKYGQNAFTWEVIEHCKVDILNDRERHWIASLDCITPNGYNMTAGGEGSQGWTPSKETRRKIGNGNRGKKRTPEHIEKIRKNSTGRKHTPESKRKISESQKGRKLSPESLEKMSQSKKAQLARDGHPMKGRKHSAETRKKMSKARKNPNQLLLDID